MSLETSASSRLSEEEWIPETAIKENKTEFHERKFTTFMINPSENWVRCRRKQQVIQTSSLIVTHVDL